MPMPPVLPILDWKAIFCSGLSFEAWLEAAEKDQNRQAMQQALVEQQLRPAHLLEQMRGDEDGRPGVTLPAGNRRRCFREEHHTKVNISRSTIIRNSCLLNIRPFSLD